MHIFLKYCTENPRPQFYHALAYESSARPGELLKLKIKDISPQPDEQGGKLCALIEVDRYGKKEQGRIVGITELSLQYYERYLNAQHPNPTNREAFAFHSKELSGRFRNVPVGLDGMRADYKFFFKNKHIPKLLKRLDIPESDKKHLQFLKDTKKWNPYIMRHSSLIRLAPDISDYQLRRHAGWSKRSNMVEVYTHSRDGESAEDILLCYGVNI